MLDPVQYKDWQIAQEAEKTLPSVQEFAARMGLEDDEIIPYESSRNLFSSLSSGSANFITVEGVLHNDFFSSPEVITAIMNCLEVS